MGGFHKKVNCRHYKGEPGGGHSLVREFSGRGHSPFHPDHNSSYLYTRGSLYAATVADFSATDSLIIKNQLRTEQYDYMHLNSPDFVGSLEDDDHVYFFFREAAVEFMNCGKAVYSRVARVCKKCQQHAVTCEPINVTKTSLSARRSLGCIPAEDR